MTGLDDPDLVLRRKPYDRLTAFTDRDTANARRPHRYAQRVSGGRLDRDSEGLLLFLYLRELTDATIGHLAPISCRWRGSRPTTRSSSRHGSRSPDGRMLGHRGVPHHRTCFRLDQCRFASQVGS